ncbi:MAG: hypothetical protein ABFD54_06455 [Armatimonadota bacterium]|nr:hypothetical protein [bacterium]
MCGKHQEIKVIMELADSAIPSDADTVADALALDLQSDVVTRWSDEVREAIACSKRIANPLSPVQANLAAQRRDEIQARITLLERELLELRSVDYEHK